MGGSYLFQWWSSTIKAGTQIDDVLTSAGGAALHPNTTNVIGGRGQYQLGTFAATTPTQTFTFTGVGSSVAVASYLNGFQLRQLAPPPVVPEPGTALFGLALLGTVPARRAWR